MKLKREKKVEAVTEKNPWLDIKHEHDMLNATSPEGDRAQLVCGLCGLRQEV